mgnify:CR=1 FL=1
MVWNRQFNGISATTVENLDALNRIERACAFASESLEKIFLKTQYTDKQIGSFFVVD